MAHADLVWPALFVELRLLSLPVIAFGLLVEIAALRWFFSMSLNMAVQSGVLVNLISAIAGIFLIPIVGIGWEFFPGCILYDAFDLGTFNPITWAATFLIATLVTTAIELWLLCYRLEVPRSWRTVAIWTIANAASVSLAFLSVALAPEVVTLFDLWPFD